MSGQPEQAGALLDQHFLEQHTLWSLVFGVVHGFETMVSGPRPQSFEVTAFHDRQDQFSEARQQELAQLAFPELNPSQALQRLRAVTRYLLEGAR